MGKGKGWFFKVKILKYKPASMVTSKLGHFSHKLSIFLRSHSSMSFVSLIVKAAQNATWTITVYILIKVTKFKWSVLEKKMLIGKSTKGWVLRQPKTVKITCQNNPSKMHIGEMNYLN